MAHAGCTEAEFIQLYESIGPDAMVRKGISNRRNIQGRRSRIEDRIGRRLISPTMKQRGAEPSQSDARISITIQNGTILVGSDAHYWPGIITTAHRAFVHFARELKPKVIVKNGDVMDFPSISRHTPIGWEHRPQVVNEIEAAQERLADVLHEMAEVFSARGDFQSAERTSEYAAIARKRAHVLGLVSGRLGITIFALNPD